MKRSKNYNESLKLVDKTKLYETKEAVDLVVSTSKAKFDETVELHVRLGVDGRNADQQVRGVVVLPEGTGKTVKVLVVAKGDKADEARKAGADVVGDDDVVAKIMGGWLDFDVCSSKVRHFHFSNLFKLFDCDFSNFVFWWLIATFFNTCFFS